MEKSKVHIWECGARFCVVKKQNLVGQTLYRIVILHRGQIQSSHVISKKAILAMANDKYRDETTIAEDTGRHREWYVLPTETMYGGCYARKEEKDRAVRTAKKVVRELSIK